jgi:3-oxoacyl-[acyl-carrier protein] reductase
MDLGIRNKVAVVTGSSGGLGLAVALRLAEEGCKLVLFARSADKLASVAADIRARFGVEAVAVCGDMTKADDVDRLVAEVKRAYGAPDILVVNTGKPPSKMRPILEETDDARWEEAYQVQLASAVLLTRKLVPAMAERGWGRVIGVTSASVKHPMPHHALSTVYRAGITALMKHLANELAPKGITVNSVGPASIATDGWLKSYDPDDRAKTLPVRRMGKPEEFAALVAFLCSDLAGFLTGGAYYADGGMIAALQ